MVGSFALRGEPLVPTPGPSSRFLWLGNKSQKEADDQQNNPKADVNSDHLHLKTPKVITLAHGLAFSPGTKICLEQMYVINALFAWIAYGESLSAVAGWNHGTSGSSGLRGLLDVSAVVFYKR